jgi:hypothetical protein
MSFRTERGPQSSQFHFRKLQVSHRLELVIYYAIHYSTAGSRGSGDEQLAKKVGGDPSWKRARRLHPGLKFS